MQGFEKLGDNWVPFDQYMKCSGRLIAKSFHIEILMPRQSRTMI